MTNPFFNSGGLIGSLVEKQGWTRETLGDLACQYIAERRLSTKFFLRLEKIAEKENSGGQDETV